METIVTWLEFPTQTNIGEWLKPVKDHLIKLGLTETITNEVGDKTSIRFAKMGEPDKIHSAIMRRIESIGEVDGVKVDFILPGQSLRLNVGYTIVGSVIVIGQPDIMILAKRNR